MKTYVGTKIIQAEPMDEKTFDAPIKGKDWGEGEPSRLGYRVIYPDGYVSWSPKETFEIAYREITDLEKILITGG